MNKVLKAKHFPNSNTSNAKSNSKDNYIWVSIIQIKDDLLK